MIGLIEFLGLENTLIVAIAVGIVLASQIVGEILELTGKVVPEFLKIRKYIKRKRNEKKEAAQTLEQVKQLLADVNSHYSQDNIAKRDDWMHWVNERATMYDDSIVAINNTLTEVSQALRDNTKLTEEMFIQNSRDRVIDFASKAGSDDAVVSREEFNRIFKVYNDYERFLEERNLTNGEIDIAYRIIKESYENHMRHHSFVENIRGYDN